MFAVGWKDRPLLPPGSVAARVNVLPPSTLRQMPSTPGFTRIVPSRGLTASEPEYWSGRVPPSFVHVLPPSFVRKKPLSALPAATPAKTIFGFFGSTAIALTKKNHPSHAPTFQLRSYSRSTTLRLMNVARATAEIHDLHEFLVDWFRGDCPNDEAALSTRFSSHFDPTFMFAPTAGPLITLESLVVGLRAEYGVSPGIAIVVRNVRQHIVSPELGVFTYEEWQRDAANATPANNGRLSTVIFRQAPTAPGGLQWAHLHETMFPDDVLSAADFRF
jgi:hypothetical protein